MITTPSSLRHVVLPVPRAMAGFLFEYAMPGLRREPLPKIEHNNGDDKPALTPEHPRPILKDTRYGRLVKLRQRMASLYGSPGFAAYVRHYQGVASPSWVSSATTTTTSAAAEQPQERQRTTQTQFRQHPPIAFSQREQDILRRRMDAPAGALVPFERLWPEYRRAYAVVDWMHAGNREWHMANPRQRQAAYFYILATDRQRRQCLLDIEDESSTPSSSPLLHQAIKTAYGRDEYPMRIRKRLKRMRWLCEEALRRHKPTKSKKRKLEARDDDDDGTLNPKTTGILQLDKADAIYLLQLYDLVDDIADDLKCLLPEKNSNIDIHPTP